MWLNHVYAYSTLQNLGRERFFFPFWAFFDRLDQNSCSGLNSRLFPSPICSIDAHPKYAVNHVLRIFLWPPGPLSEHGNGFYPVIFQKDSAGQLFYPQFFTFFFGNRLNQFTFKMRSQPHPQILNLTYNKASWWKNSLVGHHFSSLVSRTAHVASDLNCTFGL